MSEKNYPYQVRCSECEAIVYIQWSKNKQKEYATNSSNRTDFHNTCHISKVRPRYSARIEADVPQPKLGVEQPMTQQQLKPEHQLQKKDYETTDASGYQLKPGDAVIKFKTADQMAQIKEKITEISLSRTGSYKYGVSREYATEKEEIMDSLTYGIKLEIEATDIPSLERITAIYQKHIDAVIFEKIIQLHPLKMIGKDWRNK